MSCAWGRAVDAALSAAALAGIVHVGGDGFDRYPAGVQTARLLRGNAGFAPSVTAAESLSWHGGTLATATAESVTVYVSDTYAPEQVVAQKWADFFSGLPHGSELASVTVRIAPVAEVATLCRAGDVAGCYRRGELVFAGETAGGSTPEDIARHEYGHHIAANRANPPWRALDWGTKRWATVEQVCSRVKAGTAFPGNEDERYELNPGEAFAEAYRLLAGRTAGAVLSSWGIVDGSFYPDAAALSALEQDVVKPWRAPTTSTLRTRFLPSGPRRRLLPVALPLDGQIVIELRLPPGRLDTLELLSSTGNVLARGLWAGTSMRRLSYVACGLRRITLRVTRVGDPGRFAITVTRP